MGGDGERKKKLIRRVISYTRIYLRTFRPCLERRKRIGILQEPVPEERKPTKASGMWECHLPFRRKQSSLYAKHRNQKICSDSKEELLSLCPLGLGLFSLPHSYLLLPAMTVP
jgi:hypothetical protein